MLRFRKGYFREDAKKEDNKVLDVSFYSRNIYLFHVVTRHKFQ